MRTLYLDCSYGISENRWLGALIECGASPEDVAARLTPGRAAFTMAAAESGGISGIRVDLESLMEPRFGSWSEFGAFVQRLEIRPRLHDPLIKAVSRLVSAGAEVDGPGVSVSSASLRTMAGTAAALDILGVDSVSASPLSLGGGPGSRANLGLAAALARLAVGAAVQAGVQNSTLSSPCGLALLSALAPVFGPLPTMRLEAAGCGIGPGTGDWPDAVLAYLGETSTVPEATAVVILETNLDDMAPQALDYVMELLLQRGALDVYFTSIQMKKNRPAVMVSVLCAPERMEACMEILLRETTTLGVRVSRAERHCLQRRVVTVDTDYGTVPVKAAILGDRVRSVMPEYDVCRQLAISTGVPLHQIREAATTAALVQLELDNWQRLGPQGA